METLEELYQEVILDHCKNPRNFGPMLDPTQEAQGHNPLCGDCVSVYLQMSKDTIERIKFSGTGCAISTASASLMTDAVLGRTVTEARDLVQQLRDVLLSKDLSIDLGPMEPLRGVREYPMRIKCATLPWHTLLAALDQIPVTSTE